MRPAPPCEPAAAAAFLETHLRAPRPRAASALRVGGRGTAPRALLLLPPPCDAVARGLRPACAWVARRRTCAPVPASDVLGALWSDIRAPPPCRVRFGAPRSVRSPRSLCLAAALRAAPAHTLAALHGALETPLTLQARGWRRLSRSLVSAARRRARTPSTPSSRMRRS